MDFEQVSFRIAQENRVADRVIFHRGSGKCASGFMAGLIDFVKLREAEASFANSVLSARSRTSATVACIARSIACSETSLRWGGPYRNRFCWELNWTTQAMSW